MKDDLLQVLTTIILLFTIYDLNTTSSEVSKYFQIILSDCFNQDFDQLVYLGCVYMRPLFSCHRARYCDYCF